jgi:DNA-nicking Smr family endonuclease
MRRPPRRLTEAESRLWQSVNRATRRLRPAAPEPAGPADGIAAGLRRPAPRAPAPPAAPPVPAPPKPPGRPPAPRIDLAPDPVGLATSGPARIDRRRFDRMIRGRLAPEARLDLHGMSRDEARAAFVSFILASQARGLRLVLVITGKGRPDPSDAVIPERQGILRHSLPHWIAAPPLVGRVVEMRQAHRRHGGQGALYLYLRRPG